MVDTKKEQEREELHRAIWAIADDLRGAVDGWDFKSYVLGTMFYRYISENIASYINQGEIDAGNPDFRYEDMPDAEAEQAREGLVQEKGFFILPSELFCNVRAKAANDENLNETLETVFRHIEESAKGSSSEGQFAGLFDDYDVNSNKLGATVAKRNEKLVKLLNGVADMNLGDVKEHDIDAFGDAYEYLMTMYASNAGKSGGEFFTPADVSELLTRLGTVGKKEINKVYDPACGSGSLLLKAEKVLGRDAVRNGFFGQEINITTYNLCRINMFLHDIEFDKFDIACEDTLTNPQHWDDEPFELIVSNPPYSIKWPVTRIRCSSMTLALLRLVCWLRRAKRTWPLLCTRWHGWLPTVRLQSSVSPASCTVAAQSRRSANIWWTTTSLTASSSCRATCSLVPVLPPASWC